MKTYRVSMLRVYAVAQVYDVEAATAEQAQEKALAAVNDKRPDPRKEAEDSKWQPHTCTGIREIGAVVGPLPLKVPMSRVDRENHPDVFEPGA